MALYNSVMATLTRIPAAEILLLYISFTSHTSVAHDGAFSQNLISFKGECTRKLNYILPDKNRSAFICADSTDFGRTFTSCSATVEAKHTHWTLKYRFSPYITNSINRRGVKLSVFGSSVYALVRKFCDLRSVTYTQLYTMGHVCSIE